MNILLGLLFIAIGFFLVLKTQTLVQSFGHIGWAENSFPGGTYALYKLVGVFSIFFAILVATGKLSGFLVNIVGPLFGVRQ